MDHKYIFLTSATMEIKTFGVAMIAWFLEEGRSIFPKLMHLQLKKKKKKSGDTQEPESKSGSDHRLRLDKREIGDKNIGRLLQGREYYGSL